MDWMKLGDDGSSVQSAYCSWPAFYVDVRGWGKARRSFLITYLVTFRNTLRSSGNVKGRITILSSSKRSVTSNGSSSNEREAHDVWYERVYKVNNALYLQCVLLLYAVFSTESRVHCRLNNTFIRSRECFSTTEIKESGVTMLVELRQNGLCSIW